MLLHPIILQFAAARLKLPPGGFHALMAAATLLVPQILAMRLVFRRRVTPSKKGSLRENETPLSRHKSVDTPS